MMFLNTQIQKYAAKYDIVKIRLIKMLSSTLVIAWYA